MKYNFESLEINQSIQSNDSKKFLCWNCEAMVVSFEGFDYINCYPDTYVRVCGFCKAPNIVHDGSSIIAPLYGRNIENLPKEIKTVYQEIRCCIKDKCFAAALMLLRKLIMHIAVDLVEDCKDDLTFQQYVDKLRDGHFITNKSYDLVDFVRKQGNSANHKIETVSEKTVEECFKFMEILLVTNYELADEDIKNEI